MPDLSTTAGVDKEWQRLMFLTRKWVRYAGQQNDPLPGDGRDRHLAARRAGLLRAQQLGGEASPCGRARRPRRGLARIRRDAHVVRRAARRSARSSPAISAVYTGVKGIPRGHGNWQSNKNRNLTKGLNKDWNGRPKYQQAYVTAYFATRQWIRAVRTWLGNEPLWKRAQSLPTRPGSATT